jgi:hypothetical protein
MIVCMDHCVSGILAWYNATASIARCLDSVLAHDLMLVK